MSRVFDELSHMLANGVCRRRRCARACKELTLHPGDLIPPAAQLAQEYNSSKSEISKACARLVIEGALATPEEVCKYPYYVDFVPERVRSATQIIHIMLQLIESGQLGPGSWLPAPKVIAAHFDASAATLRTRMIGRTGYRRVLELRKGLGWYVHPRENVAEVAAVLLEGFTFDPPAWALMAYNSVSCAKPTDRLSPSEPQAFWLLRKFGLAEELHGPAHGKIVRVPEMSMPDFAQRCEDILLWFGRHVINPDQEGQAQFMELIV